MAKSENSVSIPVTFDLSGAAKVLRDAADAIEAMSAPTVDDTQPEPIKPGDYVRLTGGMWGEPTFPAIRSCQLVTRIDDDGDPVFEWRGQEFTCWRYDGADWSAERITVTADLDDPWDLPMPEVGEWVWWERRDGHIAAGRVEAVNMGETYASVVIEDDLGASICTDPNCKYPEDDLIAWGTYDPADLTPDEPTTFGYVGYVTDADGDVWDVTRDEDGDFLAVRRKDGRYEEALKWPDVLELGTSTPAEATA